MQVGEEGQRKEGRRGSKTGRKILATVEGSLPPLLAARLSPRTVIRRAFVPAESEAEERQLAVVDRSGRVGAGRLFGHVVQVLGREIGRVGQRAVGVLLERQYDQNVFPQGASVWSEHAMEDPPELRDKGRFNVADRGPVDAGKERVSLDLVRRVATQSLVRRGHHPGARRGTGESASFDDDDPRSAHARLTCGSCLLPPN